MHPIFFNLFAGFSTMIGYLLIDIASTDFCEGFAAGVMMIVSIFDVVFGALQGELSAEAVSAYLLIGVGCYLLMKAFTFDQQNHMLDFWIISLHNFPESLCIALSSLKSTSSGAMIFAVVLHNVAQGLVVAQSVYTHSGSRMQAFWYTLLCSISEPIGGVLGYLMLYVFLNDYVIHSVLAVVAGIMIADSYDMCEPNAKNMIGRVVGASIMGLSMFGLNLMKH